MKWLATIALTAAISISAAGAEQRILHLRSVPDSQLVHKVQAAYPPDAMDARIEGVVRIRLTIGTDGRVEDARLISGHRLLAPAAMQAARQRVYKPFESEGKPIRVVTEVEIPFALP
jgi:TonB family protein